MSTTRWIIETPCEHGEQKGHWLEQGEPAAREWTNQHGRMCLGGSHLVVDPANLPPEAIQRAAEAHYEAERDYRGDQGIDWPAWEDLKPSGRAWWVAFQEAAVRAFLSDPEPGDQT